METFEKLTFLIELLHIIFELLSVCIHVCGLVEEGVLKVLVPVL
jgi:uncharacterized metal-binding protein